MSSKVSFAKVVERIALPFMHGRREQFDFKKIHWSRYMLTGQGMSGPTPFSVGLEFSPPNFAIEPDCSICGVRLCPHASALLLVVMENEIAENIEENNYAPCTFGLNGKKRKSPDESWKLELENLTQRLRHPIGPEPDPPRFPKGRETIYVIQQQRFGYGEDKLEVAVATRPVPGQEQSSKTGKVKKSSGSIYRDYRAGLTGLAASADPIDREVAEKVSLTSHMSAYHDSRQVRFSLSTEASMGLIARMARTGKLFRNSEYSLHNGIAQVGWLCDEPFELKFEIAACDPDNLSLGICAVSSSMRVLQKDLKTITPLFFVDSQDRLGIFSRAVDVGLIDSFKSRKPIRVPRVRSNELLEKVLNLPAGLAAEFVDCEDLQPPRIAAAPKSHIHIKAPRYGGDVLEATAHCDYEGIQVSLYQRKGEIFDKSRSAIVPIDAEFHDRCRALLTSIGVKARQYYDGPTLSLNKKKLPTIVSTLIHHGWHVEAEGKLYRTGSRFDITIASGIDWFELQGKAHFDEAAVDLPRLLHSLRAGESTVVLDDGSIGLIPEQWIKRFGGVANLATEKDGSARFGKAQIGLLDAMLAERGDINVDEKFAAARQSLRDFDRIEPQEPPAGFVGELRPYQKLAQGWFEFLRSLAFGGCLADDMGLGKTIQVLAMLERRRELKSGPSLIVVPRSLVFNWIAEARKFTPNLRVLDQSHSQRTKGTDHLSDFELVLTTYGTIRRDAAFLKDFEFDYVILDEAQAIKNASTEAAKAARLLQSRHKLALSGTPIENHLGELWSLFDFLNPGMFGRLGRFADIAQGDDADQRKFIAAAVRPFILRRTKKVVAPELPDRVEQTVLVELDPDQRRAYDELRDYYRTALRNKIDTDGIGKSQIVILEALLRLRQAACHPGLVDKSRVDEASAKLDELLLRLNTALESKERVLVFSQFTSLLAIVKARLKREKIDFLYLDGQTTNRQALVEQFQSGTGPAVFLISLKAGGVGLNLTAARTVVLLDPWWNPAVEAQAIDRTHRIGQEQTVFATRLIAADTVEQKVLELQAKKKGLADAIVNADNTGISSLTREDLELLLA